MAKNFGSNVNLNKNELQNPRIHNLAADPGSPVEGQLYYNTVSKKKRTYNGTTWDQDASSSGDVVGPSSAVASEVVLFDGTTGKLIKSATISGIAKLTSGVLSAGTAGTDYTTPSSTEAFTNKTFNANGSGNAITNIETADFASNVVDTDVSLTANSDTRLASQKAVKAYIDALLNAQDAMVFKGAIDCSANPNFPAANAGYVYKVSVAGKIGGASGTVVQAGDTLYCITDSSAGGTLASVGADWVVVQNNLEAASTTVAGYVELATAAETIARTDAVRAVTPLSMATFPQKFTVDIGDGVTTAIAITHNLGSKAVTYSVRKKSDDTFWEIEGVATSTSVLTLTFVVAPTSAEYEVTVIG